MCVRARSRSRIGQAGRPTIAASIEPHIHTTNGIAEPHRNSTASTSTSNRPTDRPPYVPTWNPKIQSAESHEGRCALDVPVVEHKINGADEAPTTRARGRRGSAVAVVLVVIVDGPHLDASDITIVAEAERRRRKVRRFVHQSSSTDMATTTICRLQVLARNITHAVPKPEDETGDEPPVAFHESSYSGEHCGLTCLPAVQVCHRGTAKRSLPWVSLTHHAGGMFDMYVGVGQRWRHHIGAQPQQARKASNELLDCLSIKIKATQA